MCCWKNRATGTFVEGGSLTPADASWRHSLQNIPSFCSGSGEATQKKFQTKTNSERTVATTPRFFSAPSKHQQYCQFANSPIRQSFHSATATWPFSSVFFFIQMMFEYLNRYDTSLSNQLFKWIKLRHIFFAHCYLWPYYSSTVVFAQGFSLAVFAVNMIHQHYHHLLIINQVGRSSAWKQKLRLIISLLIC